MKQLFVILVGVFICLFGIFVSDAHAYLDPGTGSYFFQIFIAFVIGGLFAIKMFWSKIALFIKSLFLKNKKNG